MDHNASAPLLPVARDAMVAALDHMGNASSVHHEGRKLRHLVEDARAKIAYRLNTDPAHVVFSSGASESAAHALSPRLRTNGGEEHVSRLYVSAIEHPAVLAGGRFTQGQIETISVKSNGVVDLGEIQAAMDRHDWSTGKAMLALMLANNETGVIQPVREAASIVHAAGGYVLVDAVQAFGKLDFTLSETGADFLILSSHKMGGPKGAGALVLADRSISPMPLITGGGQESFHRAGTENTTAIAGFGAAAGEGERLAKRQEIRVVRDFIEQEICTICYQNDLPDPVIFGRDQDRLDNTSYFAVQGLTAETALIALDLAGFAISTGSACSSGKVKKSHVLDAMGVGDDLSACALRISLGPEHTKKDALRLCEALNETIRQSDRRERRIAV